MQRAREEGTARAGPQKERAWLAEQVGWSVVGGGIPFVRALWAMMRTLDFTRKAM